MNDNNLKKLQNKLINAFFMQSPHPMTITRAEDGTYLEINEAAARYMGFPRGKLIGRKSTEIGHMPLAIRQMIIKEIKAKGYAKSIKLKSRPQKNEVQHLLFNVFPMKIGKNSFFLSVVTDISTSKRKDKVLFALRLRDKERVKENLKQYKLTPRQQEVAILASCGHSNTEIAAKMNVSENTVKDYIKKVFETIGVHNRGKLFPTLLNPS